MKKQPERPVLITDAARSQDDQFRSRQIRYVTMMGLRAACLILGAILISVQPPLLPVWLILCAAGMVILPWAAVLIANDRPAPQQGRARRRAAAATARARARSRSASTRRRGRVPDACGRRAGDRADRCDAEPAPLGSGPGGERRRTGRREPKRR